MDGIKNGVLITGAGCVSPFGEGLGALWRGLLTGREAVPSRWFDSTAFRSCGVHELAEPPSIDAPISMLQRAATQAIVEADLSEPELRNAGLVLASTSAGWHLGDDSFTAVPGPRAELHGLVRKEAPAVALTERWGLSGPSAVISSACASSTGALAWACERIRAREADLVLVAAVDVLTEVVFAGFHSLRLLTEVKTRPFAASRDGFILAEGAGVLVVESAEHARRRGQLDGAALLGWGASSDAFHLTTPSAEGIGRGLSCALADAGLENTEIGLYHAHGTASPASDRAEAEAIRKVLVGQERRMPTAAIKSSLGHTEGAAGLFAVIAALTGLELDTVPPILHTSEPDPDFGALDLVDTPRPHPQGAVMIHASGFGGANCTVVVDRTLRERPSVPRIPVYVTAGTWTHEGQVHRAGWHPRWEAESPTDEPRPVRSPKPDRSCLLLSNAAGALLGSLPADLRATCKQGGLLIGTEYGMQQHHARMMDGIRHRGHRGVDPMDFALSTFNVPAAMVSVLYEVTGQTETFLGRAGSTEALVSAAGLIATGRVRGMMAGGYDAPENRLHPVSGEEVPAGATLLALTTDPGDRSKTVELAASVRLPIASQPTDAACLDEALERLTPRRPDLMIAVGTEAGSHSGDWRAFMPGQTGAATPVRAHFEAVEQIASGDAEEAVVAVTGPYSATVLVLYRRIGASSEDWS